MEEAKTHEGHRERMRIKLNEKGADGMAPEDVLELALFCSIPRADTRELALKLLKRFGSFSGVLNAPVKDLMRVEGVGGKTAELLHMLPQFARYYLDDLAAKSKRIFDVNSAYEQMKSKFVGRTRECVAALILNSRGQIMFDDILCQGTVSQVPIYVRELVELCIRFDADTVVLGHNHVSGNPAPSKGDIVATKELQLALDGVYVNLEDHIIFTHAGYTSMRKSGWLSDVTVATEQFRQNMLMEAMAAEESLNLDM